MKKFHLRTRKSSYFSGKEKHLICFLNEVPSPKHNMKKHTIVIHSGLLECLEDDEIYSVLAHECGHIACKHSLYHTLAIMILDGTMVGLNDLVSAFAPKGVIEKSYRQSKI